MQVLLNTDANVDGREAMAEHLAKVANDAMGRFGEQVTRIEAYLSDANSLAKAGPDEIHCTLEARLLHRDPIVVKDQAATAHQAINGALGKLKRAVGTAVTKHNPRRAGDASIGAEDEPAVPE